MTKPNSQRWRMPLFVLALIFVASLPFFSAGASGDDVVTITTFPADYQLYPRDGADKGTITVAGTVSNAGAVNTDSVRVDVLRNGAAYSSETGSLDGSGNFSVDVTIDAELADYTVKLFTVDGGTDSIQATADNVVAGDVFVIQGQSNAVAGMYTIDDDGYPDNDPTVLSSIGAQNDYVRTYGSSTGDASVIQLDDNWYVADGDGFNDAGTIGQWGLKMADTLVDSYNIPIAVINGAFGGEEISFFQRDDSNKLDLTTNYGRLLYRMQESGLQNDIKAIFWYQGESDEGDVELHLAGFDAIYSDWNEDYPSAQQIYAFQLADFCFEDNLEQREAQRRLPETYSDVSILSTNAINGHRKDCHYWWQNGYETLGENAARIVGRDFYGAADIAVDAPDLQRAYFSNNDRTEVTLQLENYDGLTFDDDALYRFNIYSDADEFVQQSLETVDTVNGRIIFNVQIDYQNNAPVPPVGNLTATFEGDPWLKIGEPEADQDNVTNSNGVGLLTFNAKVFDAVDAPEAVIRVDTPLQGTLTGSSVGFDLKGEDSTDPDGDNLQYRWRFVNADGSLSDPIGYSANKYLFIDQPGTYEVELSVYDGNPDGSPAPNSDFVREKLLVFADTTSSCVQHGLNYERFDNIPGTSIDDLVNANVFGTPSSHSYIENFEIPANIGEDYGARIRGYIVPPISGDYEFWVASDDESKVWIHSNTAFDTWDLNNVVPDISASLAATPTVYIENFGSPERQFEESESPWNGSQWTAGVEFDGYDIFTKTLEVGKLYYVEALFKEGSAGDHMSLGWKLPGARGYSLIGNDNLCVLDTGLPLAPTPVINTNTTSGAAPLTVFFDSSASSDEDGSITGRTWSYGDGKVDNQVSPAYAYETPGTYYAVLSVTDDDNFINHAVEKIEVAEPDCSVDGKGILFERFDNVGGRLIEDMFEENPITGDPAIATYDDGGVSYVARLNSFEMPSNVGDEYAARFRGYIVPDSTDNYIFRIAGDDQAVMFLSTDDDPANKVAIASVTNLTPTVSFDPLTGSIGGNQGWTPERDWLNVETKYPNQESATPIPLVAAQRYYVEVLYKEELFGDHLSVGWQKESGNGFDLILCHNLEPFNENAGGSGSSGELAIHNLEIDVQTSQTTVPSTGALVEYRVTLTNASADELGADPIQISGISDSLHGEISSTASGWQTPFVENTCWWWIPELWNGQSWTCSYTKWVSGEGEQHDVTVTGQSNSGLDISESAAVEFIGATGPGVKSTAAWAADDQATIEQYTQLIDTDGELDIDFDVYAADVRDTEGILIGDYDLDGVCDMWQTWWLRNCIALSTSDVMSVLDNDSSTDMRDRLLRSLTATWLNIAAGNEYECADMRTSINLGLIWLSENGNPLEGGSVISPATNPLWTQIEYVQVWYDWYNDTGGNYCAETASGSPSTCGSLGQEAEIAGEITNPNNGKDYIFGNRLQVVSDANANGGEFLQGKTNKDNQWSMQWRWRNNGTGYYRSSHRAEYCVYVPADGYYTIDAWVRTPNGGNDNSFFVQFNNGGYALWDTAYSYNSFGYSAVNHRGWNGATARWYLTEGEHTLKFHLRENGTQLDRFDVKAEGSRGVSELPTIDAGTPTTHINGAGPSGPSDHYMYQWLVDGNNAAAGSRSGNHSGDFATAMAGFLTDADALTEQDEIAVGGAVGYIEGSVDIDASVEDAIQDAGVENFAPDSLMVPTAVSVSGAATGTAPVWQLMAIMMSIVTLGAVMLRKRTQ